MPYGSRELVVRAREAAALLLATLDRNEMVPRFLDMYAAENRRPGRADQPAHYHEQLETIRREAILAMVLRAADVLPARLRVRVNIRELKRGANKRSKLKKVRKSAKVKQARKSRLDLAIPLLDLFREEFFVALGQALNWSDQDAQEFWRDLELYESLNVSHGCRSRSGQRRASAPPTEKGRGKVQDVLIDQAGPVSPYGNRMYGGMFGRARWRQE